MLPRMPLAPTTPPPPRPDDARALMWLNADRVVYVGLLGAPSVRSFGAHSIYLSLARPHRICIGNGASVWQTTPLSVVPPHTPHRIESDEPMICSIVVELDTVDAAQLPAPLRGARGALDAPALAAALRRAVDAFRHGPSRRFDGSAEFDRAFFGAPLATRPLDPRIAAVLTRMKAAPDQPHAAVECAASVHLSVSRFLHLFKADVGVPFRAHRTWQRARSLLYHVRQRANLTTIALDAGYPDSTHFSHSIRHVYGLTPKSIFDGCRRLALYGRDAG